MTVVAVVAVVAVWLCGCVAVWLARCAEVERCKNGVTMCVAAVTVGLVLLCDCDLCMNLCFLRISACLN